MTIQTISSRQAKKIALCTQFLDGNTGLPKGKEGIAQTIEHLGYIQIDTISVVNRSHHHTLWTRHPDYTSNMLHDLLAKDRRIFEYWGHAMSYLPIKNYRFFHPRMRYFLDPKNKWIQVRLDMCRDVMKPVLERIRKEGPLSSKDFKAPPDKKKGTWWDWKPAKAALELLFWQGELMITERNNFQKVYDLTERVLSEDLNVTPPDENELGQFFVTSALEAYGVARKKEIRSFMQPDGVRDAHFRATGWDTTEHALNILLETGKICPIKIDGIGNEKYYVLSDTLNHLPENHSDNKNVYFLSPFDNLIIQRERIKCLFGFDYMLECYVPEPKRKYGYFSLPILWKEQLIGRLDPKADRKTKILSIRNLIFEPEFKDFDPFILPFAEKLHAFAEFNGCKKIGIENISHPKIKKNLENALTI